MAAWEPKLAAGVRSEGSLWRTEAYPVCAHAGWLVLEVIAVHLVKTNKEISVYVHS